MSSQSEGLDGKQRPLEEVWKDTRSGAWSARGFDYQHMVSTLLLVRQWAGLAPTGDLVPEGLEDCVIDLGTHSIWLQIKSRKDGQFGVDEVQGLLDAVLLKAAAAQTETPTRSAIVLERPRTGRNTEAPIDEVFGEGAGIVVECTSPRKEATRILSAKLPSLSTIIESLVNSLYALVAEASVLNASLAYPERRKISTTEVHRLITESLKAQDPTAIERAFVSGALEPVDFNTPVAAPDFYRGVKVNVGHVAAGLVLDRPDDVANVLAALDRRGNVLVCAPSGAGKSALVWLAASALARARRWLRVTATATAADAAAIVACVRSHSPTDAAPVGVVFDEVGPLNSDLWNVLARELRRLGAVCLLGSVRREDQELVANQSDTELISVSLDQELAKAVWERLFADGKTDWSHWCEPFEESEGLMLEYVHLLTQGRRLAAVVEDQLRTRERQGRVDELAIVRSASAILSRGGDVVAARLPELLDLSQFAVSRALKRLIEEHLVRESRTGVLGGLHSLRSDALVRAAHDETVFRGADALWRSLPIATPETLPQVVQSALTERGPAGEPQALRELAELLGKSRDIDFWAAILAGLGLATLQRNVTLFVTTLEEHGIPRAHWAVASLFADPEMEVPDLSPSSGWASLQNAVRAFRTSPKTDLRSACLAELPELIQPPPSRTVVQANKLLASLSPICGGDPVGLALEFALAAPKEEAIQEIAELLSAAYHWKPEVAVDLVQAFGGEEDLLEIFRLQTPWVTPPAVESRGRHGRTIRADWFFVAESSQPDPHETIRDICETLIALSPRSDAAASDAVDAKGEPITIGDFVCWSKDMPRENLPAKSRVSWNVAFRQMVQARAKAESLTDYATRMTSLVHESEALFRGFTETWIKGKGGGPAYATFSERIEAINRAVQDLAYAGPAALPASLAEPGVAGKEELLGSLLTSVVNNLAPRITQLKNPKAIAAYTGTLQAQAEEHKESRIWRTVENPPVEALAALSTRLGHVSCIFYEIAHDPSPATLRLLVKAARKAGWGRAVARAAQVSQARAERRFKQIMRVLDAALRDRGWKAECLYRNLPEREAVSWPAREIAILLEIGEQWADLDTALEEALSVGEQHVGGKFDYGVVFASGGRILPSLAVSPSSQGPIPDGGFASRWSGCLPEAIFESEAVDTLRCAFRSCKEISGIVTCRGVSKMHPEEEGALETCVGLFGLYHGAFSKIAETDGKEHCKLALRFLGEVGGRVAREIESAEAGVGVTEPLCVAKETAQEAETICLYILQAECRDAVEKPGSAI